MKPMRRLLGDVLFLLGAGLGAGCVPPEIAHSFGRDLSLSVFPPANYATVASPEVVVTATITDSPDRIVRAVYLLNGGTETEVSAPTPSGVDSETYTASFTVPSLQRGTNEIIVRAYDAAGRSVGSVVYVNYEPGEVVLDQGLAGGGGSFAAGERIALTRIVNGHVANPDACPNRHLHAASARGIVIDGFGPYVDTKPTACGYGQVEEP